MNSFLRPAGRSLLIAGVVLGLTACGSKTGLQIPDADIDFGTIQPPVDLDGGADPDLGLPADVPCAEVPFEGGVVEVPLDLAAELARADVLFLVDSTKSMEQEIDQIRRGLRESIAPGVRETVFDSELGVATFGDFPVGMCGDVVDTPFDLALPITDDLSQVQAAVDGIRLGNGLDQPESQVEALYQTATGRGIRPFVPPSLGCPGGGLGYPCFRRDALPIVLLFTDAPFHNGPGPNANLYRDQCEAVFDRAERPPATYAEAVNALNQLGARVIGLYSRDDGEGRDDLVQLVRDTGGSTGLVFNIGSRGQRLSNSVVDAVRTLADTIEFDIDTVLVDPDSGDGVDPTAFVERVLAIRAVPSDRVESIDREAGLFFGVRAGTSVFVQLELRNDAVVPGREPQSFLLEVVFRGDERARLGSRLVRIVVPAEDGSGCEPR
ncbi:MAG: hypothetical protein ACFCGT_00720 [Sandaracinaceae bacterium]